MVLKQDDPAIGGLLGNIIQEFQNVRPKRQEIRAADFAKTKAARARAGRTRVKKTLSHYRNACLETTAEELLPIWFRMQSKPYASNQVSWDIHVSGPIEKDNLAKSHLKSTGRTSQLKQQRHVRAP